MPESSRYSARVEAGLCGACGRRKHRRGRSTCKVCAAAKNAQAAERRERAAARGLCEACMAAPRVEGRGNRCDPCADRYLVGQRKRDRARRAATRARG